MTGKDAKPFILLLEGQRSIDRVLRGYGKEIDGGEETVGEVSPNGFYPSFLCQAKRQESFRRSVKNER